MKNHLSAGLACENLTTRLDHGPSPAFEEKRSPAYFCPFPNLGLLACSLSVQPFYLNRTARAYMSF